MALDAVEADWAGPDLGGQAGLELEDGAQFHLEDCHQVVFFQHQECAAVDRVVPEGLKSKNIPMI